MELSDVLRESWEVANDEISPNSFPRELEIAEKPDSTTNQEAAQPSDLNAEKNAQDKLDDDLHVMVEDDGKRVYMVSYNPPPPLAPMEEFPAIQELDKFQEKKQKAAPTTSGIPANAGFSADVPPAACRGPLWQPKYTPRKYKKKPKNDGKPQFNTMIHPIHTHPFAEYIKLAAHVTTAAPNYFPAIDHALKASGDYGASSSSAQHNESHFPVNFLEGHQNYDVDNVVVVGGGGRGQQEEGEAGEEEALPSSSSSQQTARRTSTTTKNNQDADTNNNDGIVPEASAETQKVDVEKRMRDDEEMGGAARDGEEKEKKKTSCIDNHRVTNGEGAGDVVGEKLVAMKNKNSSLELLLQQPPIRGFFGSSKKSGIFFNSAMQFYQPPPAQHHAPPRTTPPSEFATPYTMGMRPHEEETRQIMNLDNQQAHNSSPTSSWNGHQQQQYTQMSNMNAYPPRGPPIYPPPMPHGAVPPTSNPYYPPPHMQPQAMIPPGMQQPYYSTQSPLTGTPPMNYGQPGCAAPAANGNGPLFAFSKPPPRPDVQNVVVNNGPSVAAAQAAQRRKKQPDLSSPRYQNEDIDAAIFPDMSDFPLLDVVQSKAKKDAGRKPCRPHLCEQSRMLISRVCHFNREFAKRLPSRHPLTNSPMSKPDQWTSQIMGISLATVRKCMDMAQDEEVFTRCTDKNLVNLTPAERTEREEMLAKLSTVFEEEKSLGAGTAGLTIAEYSPRRSYSSSLVRQPSSIDEKSNQSSSFYNLNESSTQGEGEGATTFMNLDETPKEPEIGALMGGLIRDDVDSIVKPIASTAQPPTPSPKEELQEEAQRTGADTPKIRGRPKKNGGNRKQKEGSTDGSEVADEKEEEVKKTEDENETTTDECNGAGIEEKQEGGENGEAPERDDDAASSEGTTRSETATPEPTTGKARRRATRRKRNTDPDVPAPKKAKTNGTAGNVDDENVEHKMVTRRSRAAQNS